MKWNSSVAMNSLNNIPIDPLCCIIVTEEYYETTIALNMQAMNLTNSGKRAALISCAVT
jgi:hypothetical protein